MANKERDEEAGARELVERITGLRLVHADRNAEVDYLTADSVTAAMEVTTVTSSKAKNNARAAEKEMSVPLKSSVLQYC